MDAGQPEQRLERGHRRASSIEAESELVEVGLQVLRIDAVMRAAEPGLEVAEHAMDAGRITRARAGWPWVFGRWRYPRSASGA